MAMSLEDLLAKEGFNKKISKTTPRASSDIRCHDLKSKHKIGSYDISSNVKRISISSFDEFLSAEGSQNNEIVEVEERNDSRYNRIYSNRTYRNESSSAEENTEKCLDKSSKVGYQKHMERLETSNSRSTRSSVTSKSTDETTSLRKCEIEHTRAIPALDELAIQAVISILSGHIKRFLVDEDFRTSLRHNSFASLNFIGFEEGLNTESKIIATLEQAIETAERAAEDFASEKELKKASLQLSVITGLNSDGKFTSGIPNSKLAACAHLYLSVIYKIQNKDRIAAKHLLQVFCDSPFQARTSLLPDLWNRVFLPHLSHLKVWHDSEANFLRDLRNKSRKLNLLDKLYTENLDKGTYLFAVYYKDWLTEGAEIPLVPSIQIPSKSVSRQGSFSNLNSSVGGFSPQPVVSKKLYDEVFRRSHILGAESEESYEISVRNPATLTYSAEVIK
ncbi:putative E3 ubiquitin-protein ligase LIN-2 [Solanum pennellii]|uniref:E3 ubiquitin-protein ligase LIN-2 n=1 Tax=Solanum pennellii TaxID=28526 RepID=A0ABM1HBM7_SOLPN|nr:putative E3 ubiquitin-protein ligase LIN-2 [Solanum pennellii]